MGWIRAGLSLTENNFLRLVTSIIERSYLAARLHLAVGTDSRSFGSLVINT